MSESFENRYSLLDKLMHRIAFKTPGFQTVVSDMEDKIFAKELKGIKARDPVFITSLPRAGTTLVLELCAKLEEFATHRYKDMPFIITPLFWSKFASGFRKKDELRERAHGDGMMVNIESPEAMEEMLWMAFWEEHYKEDRILLWNGDENEEFTIFFRNHMRKLIAARKKDNPSASRYISKNNLNISRIDYLLREYPDSTIILIVRNPLQHAKDLLEQHENFSDMHAEDKFAREYMRGIGHFDFGDNLKPVDFGSWMDERRVTDPFKLDFWLEYWTNAFEHLLAKQGTSGLRFLSYDELSTKPREVLGRLADVIQAKSPDKLVEQSGVIYEGNVKEVNISEIDADILDKSLNLKKKLDAVTL